MHIRILKGTILSAPKLGELDVMENSYLVARDGKIMGVFDQLPEEYRRETVEDFGDALILQSFSDMHLHGPQYAMLGTGMELELLDWLNTCTWPTEAAFADLGFARRVYRQLARELLRNGTTRVCMFSSLHREATLILMEELENAGISGFVGKVNMDRNGGEQLQETTEGSIADTLAWLEACKGFRNVRPILTPRFSPSCTETLMRFLGELARERDLPIQSHLSESRGEIAWVKELFPNCATYYGTYQKHGLWTNKTLMAHCVWSDDREQEAMRQAGVTVVHCPDSNSNLRSGVAPVRAMLEKGLDVVLGSDISGGDKLNVFDIVNSAIKVSQLRSVYDPAAPRQLTVAEAWYLATSAANKFFDEGPGFAPGNRLNVMVVDDSKLISHSGLTSRQRLERMVYQRRENHILALYSGEKCLATNG